jgi:hypothetical protein
VSACRRIALKFWTDESATLEVEVGGGGWWLVVGGWWLVVVVVVREWVSE